jgi:hypothetical protein
MIAEPENAAFGAEEWEQPPSTQTAPGNVRIVVEGGAEEPVVKALTALLIGSATEGSDQFFQRLKAWQSSTKSLGTEIYSESPDESDGIRLRYMMIGLLSEAPDVAQGLLDTTLDVSESVYRSLSNFFEPVNNSRAMRPLWRRYDELASRGEVVAERWIDKGRRQEQHGRALARQAIVEEKDEAFNIVFDKLAQDPEPVRALVTQQSFGMADEVKDQLRSRSATADSRWERRIRKLLGRGTMQPAK